MNLQFQYPWVLFLLWLVPVIGIGWHLAANRNAGGRALVSSTMAAKLAPAPAPGRRLWQLSLLMTGLMLGLIAAARPQWGMKEDTVYQRGRDLMILLDVSRSMLARDVHPSRLGRAKADLQDLVKQLRGDRVGLMAFRGRPLLLCPLTTDYGFLSQSLEGAGVDSAPSGETDIGNAILEALQTLQEDEGSHKAIVLVSDGDDLAGKTAEAVAKARERGVALFTVGFGSTEGAPVPSATGTKEMMNFQGREVVSKLNHEILRDLAEQTGGAYVPVGLANVKLGDLYKNHLSRITTRDLEESVQRRYIERFQWFLFPAVLCFLAIAFLSRGQIALPMSTPPKGSRTPGRPEGPPTLPPVTPAPAHNAPPLKRTLPVLVTAGVWAMSLSPAPAQTNLPSGREGARLAQSYYLAGQYDDAASAYQQAARTAASTTRDDYLFNAGCALMKARKPGEAADVFRGLTGIEGELGSSAAYNLGCALVAAGSPPAPAKDPTQPDPAAAEHRVQSLKQAGSAFQKGLRLQPDDGDSRKNLAIVAGLTTEAAEQAKIIRLMAEHGKTPPGALADRMLLQQRKLIHDIPAAFTNTSPALIDALETLALDQDNTADLMIPLKGKLLQAMAQSQSAGNKTNAQQQIAMVNAFAEAIRDQMFGTATALRNLDQSAFPTASKAGDSVYTLWKGLAGYQHLLREDIERQTNAITLTLATPDNPADEGSTTAGAQQAEALILTGLFKDRFEQTVPVEGITQPVETTATNSPAGTNTTETILSKEDRARIVTLAGQAIQDQTAAARSLSNSPAASLPLQRQAYDRLKAIETLLPKQKQPQPNPPQSQQEHQQNQNQQQPNQPPENKPQEQKQPEKQEPKKDPMTQDDLKRLLEKAKQREQEHEQEKRERDATVPLSPAERDW